MTKPQITSSISLGNIIQIVVLLGGLAGAFYGMKYTSDAAAEAAASNAETIKDLQSKQQDLEMQVALNKAQHDGRVNALVADMEEIKQGLRENNSLLRQLLQSGAGAH